MRATNSSEKGSSHVLLSADLETDAASNRPISLDPHVERREIDIEIKKEKNRLVSELEFVA